MRVSPFTALIAIGSQLLLASLAYAPASAGINLQAKTDARQAVARIVEDVVRASYPELKDKRIRIKEFNARSDYFKARFGLPEFFFGRMRYLIFVNPRVFGLQAPEEGLRAIIAHELAHVVYFSRGKRLRLLGLTRLSSSRFTVRFERWADLQAIARGYGPGLREYRRWLYASVPASRLAEKRRDYFSPEEIDAVSEALRRRPELLDYWSNHVPRNLMEIREEDRLVRQ